MNNLDIHIVGLGNLGSSLLKGLKNLDNNLTFHLYEKEPKIIDFINAEFGIKPKTELETVESGVLILCIKPKDLNNFIEMNKNKISENVLICTVLAGVETSYISKFINNKIIRLMPNLSIKDNNGFIPYTKTYKEDYLSFETILNGLGIISEYEEELAKALQKWWDAEARGEDMDELIRKQFEAGKDHPNKPTLAGFIPTPKNTLN